jgi:hypothetical protein
MTRDQARSHLILAGYSPEAAEQILDRIGTEFETPEDLLRTAASQAQPDALQSGTEVPPEVQAEMGEDENPLPTSSVAAMEAQNARQVDENREELVGLIDLQEQGVPLTEEQQATVQNSPQEDLLAALEAWQARNAQFNYDWVYNDLQIKPGTLDSPEALVQLWESMVDVGAVDDNPDLSDDEKAASLQDLLTRSPSVWIVQQGVLDWAMENDAYTPNQKFDGVSVTEINSIMEGTGLTFSKAITVGKVANAHKLDPIALASNWSFQQENAGVEPGGKPEIRNAKGPSVQAVAERFKAGLDLYGGSNVLAGVHLSDPELARKLKSDPYSLDSGELRRILTYIGGTEGKEGDPQVSWIERRLAGDFEITAEYDPVAVEDAFKTITTNWNMTGAEGMAAALAGELMAQAVAQARSQLPNPFRDITGGEPVNVEQTIQDMSAHIKQRLRGHPEYQALFSHLAPGESEEEYAGRFERRSQEVLGDDIVGSVRAGMQSGNINTIYQQGITTEAGDSSTRFQELMARNARILREML